MLTRSRIIGRIHEMWRNGKDVTSEDLWKWSKENLSFTKGKTVFLHVLRGLGFLYKKKDHNTVVEERLDIIKRRGIYLNEKKKWDEKNAFYGSCDETWAHDGMVRRYGWQHSNGGNYKRARMSDLEAPQARPQQGKERGKRIIVAAVLTEKGVLPGSELLLISGVNVDEQKADYHRDMDGDNFERYYKTTVPLLAAEAQKEGRPAVLIVDNAPYHCKAIKKPPTSGSSKQEIQAFLTENGLKFFKKQNRDVLYDLVKAFIDCNGGREAFTTYEFDEYAKSHGVTVLRLPQYHCFFNPVELLWSQLKQHLRKEGNTTDTAETVRTRALRFLQNFRDVSSKDLFAHTQKIEQDVREMSEERMLTLSEEHFDLLYDVDDEGRLINVTIDGEDVDNGDFFDSFCLSDDSSDDSFDDSDDDEELIIDYTEMV
ncbi:hypothetical protein CRE_15796 [Caenorhabditis remanei]|uniref:Tc1-like transposase DDE domain-containing protein n=1 Tax=Caenorhabditis remanei TaxID=31234 RepID=E3NLY2_CAERE|nr:hypothetical protein CRE_15796 [Caenorhabditis remanei]